MLAVDSPAVEKAQARLVDLKGLSAVGAVSARQVAQAEIALAQAREDQLRVDYALRRSITRIFFKLKGTRDVSLDIFKADKDLQDQLNNKATPFYVKRG